jgi:hypothetical protein
MPSDEMHVSADRFVKKLENATARVFFRHRVEHGGEILHQFEDHASVSGWASALISMNRESVSSLNRIRLPDGSIWATILIP